MNTSRILAVTLSLLLIPGYVFVAEAVELLNPLGETDTLTEFIANLLELVVMIVFPIIVLFIVYIGFLFIAAQGNAEKLTAAKKYLLWAIVGALLVLGAQALSFAIQATVDQL